MKEQDVAGSAYRDEISLFYLWNVLVDHRKVIFTIILFSLLLALVYVFIAKPVYKAEAYLLPISKKDIQGIQSVKLLASENQIDVKDLTNLNSRIIGREIFDLYNQIALLTSVDQIHAKVVTNLNSRTVRRKLFDVHGVYDQIASNKEQTVEEVFGYFDKLLRVTVEKDNDQLVSIFFESNDAQFAFKVVNGFISIVHAKTLRDLFFDINYQTESLKESLNRQISFKQDIAKQSRLDRIEALGEALVIAKKINLVDLSKTQSIANSQGLGAKFPLYLLGVSALQAEMTVLQVRANDDPFIFGLRDLQQKLAVIDGVVIDKDKVIVVRESQKPVVPDSPIRPDKVLILILTMLFSCVVAVGVAFLRNAVEIRK